MKKMFFALATIAALSIVVFSCKKDKNPDSGAVAGTWVATVMDTTWKGSNVTAAYNFTNKHLDITMRTNYNLYPQINLTGNLTGTGLGSFDLGTSGAVVATYYTDSLSSPYISTSTGGSGTLVITNIDSVNRTISGTFNFIAPNNVDTIRTISNGVFNTIKLAS